MLKYRAVFSVRKPNFSNVTNRKLFEKKYVLLTFAADPYINLRCHERTTPGLSMNHMHNVGSCMFTRAGIYYAVKKTSFFVDITVL